MNTYGIIGNPLEHSFSKEYFTEKFRRENIRANFINFPLQSIEELENVLKANPTLRGLSVTIPYKEAVIPFLNEIDALAAQIGAVNSIRISRVHNKAYLTGYNTDVYGFAYSLKAFLGNIRPKALILGTGGASKAIAKGLEQLKINYRFVSRKAGSKNYLTYRNLNREVLEAHRLLINCSPVGTYPNTSECPGIPYQLLTPSHYLYDLVYNPEKTLFLKKGETQGAKTHNGLKMLHLQAEKSWEIWNG